MIQKYSKLALFSADGAIQCASFTKTDDGGSGEVDNQIPTAFIGTWTGTLSKGTIDNSSEVTLVITETTVTVNGNETTGLEIYLDPGYETVNFVYGGITFTIMNASYDPEVFKLALFSADGAIQCASFTKQSESGESGKPEVGSIPSEYHGTWTGTLMSGTIDGVTEVTIVVTGDAVTVNGNPTTGAHYVEVSDSDKYVSFTYGGVSFMLINSSQNPNEPKLNLFSEDYSIRCMNFTKAA